MYFATIPVSPLPTNCYLIGDEEAKVGYLIDPGDDAVRVTRMVRDSGLRLEGILLTHGHWDHRTAVPELVETFPGTPVYIHVNELSGPGRIPPQYFFPPVANTRYLEEGDTLPMGGLTIRVLETPGHSAGSLVFLVDGNMFSGDTLFEGSCGRCDLPGGDPTAMLRSLKRLHDLPGDYKVFPGHGPATTLEEERQHNPYMKQSLWGDAR